MGRVVVRSRVKKMSCFRTFDSNLPVLDVQIMGGGAGWRRAWGGQKRGNHEGETAAANLNLLVRGWGGGAGEGAHAHPVSSIRGGSTSK